MLHAERERKVTEGARYPSEDSLTSIAFGRLRYLPRAWPRLLARVRWISRDGERLRTAIDDWEWPEADHELRFWPRLGRYGEIDAVLAARDADGGVERIVGIEVKFRSGLSVARRDAPEGESSHQLASYWAGLTTHAFSDWRVPRPSGGCALVYLTAHADPPEEELLSALAIAPDMRLGWLSWRDVWELSSTYLAEPFPVSLVAHDLRRFLEHRGLDAFAGFDLLDVPSYPAMAWSVAPSSVPNLPALDTNEWTELSVPALTHLQTASWWTRKGLTEDGND